MKGVIKPAGNQRNISLMSSATGSKIGSGSNRDQYPEDSKMSKTIQPKKPTKNVTVDMSDSKDPLASTLPTSTKKKVVMLFDPVDSDAQSNVTHGTNEKNHLP